MPRKAGVASENGPIFRAASINLNWGDFVSNEDGGWNSCARENNRGPCEPVKPWMPADSVTTFCY